MHPPIVMSTLPPSVAPPIGTAPQRHSLVSLRRLSWLRWALLAGQAMLLVSCESLAGIALPYKPLLFLFAVQTVFNVFTVARLHWHTRHSTVPSDAELMVQMMVDLTALSAILFYTGGATNPFVSFYLPGLAIASAILPWRLVVTLAAYALACYSMLLLEYIPLDLHNPDNAVNYHLAGMWLNFVASAVMIAFFVARLSNALRQRDAQLNEARELLLREARVEALNDQAAAVAHEIGTPLATLAVIAGELRADAENTNRSDTPVADYQADLRTMEQQLELCRSILARLRADHETLAPQRIDAWLAPFVERWQLRHPQASLQAGAAPDAAAQAVDTARISQILTIALDNAARSQQAAGHDHRQGPPLRLDIAREADALVYRVTDHGHGLPPGLRARLGESPVASAHGGQGIGLYLAQSAARQLGGQISWHDNPAGGTVLELRLPLTAVSERAIAAQPDFQP